MQNPSSPQTKNPFLVLRIVWGALVFSCLIYGLILKMMIDQTPTQEILVRSFPQVIQTQYFSIAVLIAFVFVTLSRLAPKFIFRSQLKKQNLSDRQQIVQCYWTGFVLGLVFLEAVALIGFLLVLKYKFLPIYWVFGFVAIANMLIRYPSWAYIKFLAEDSLKKPVHL